MTFCGKDASCYCPRSCVFKLNRDTNAHVEDEAAEETDVSSTFRSPPQPFMPSSDVRTRILSVSPSLTVRWSLLPTDDPHENKQQLARRDSRKPFVLTKWTRREQVCFAGSGCLPLCRLGPGPWALSGPGWGRRGGGCELGALAGIHRRRHCRNPASNRLTSSTRCCGRFSNKDCAHFQGSVRLHHGKRRLSPTPVYHKHTAHFCPIGGASALLSSRHLQRKHDVMSQHKPVI